jgi:polyketide cyclase/dehydrase/lipid transport protein
VAHQGIDIRKTTPAEPAAVWRLLGDSFTWPSWTPIEWVIVDRHGDKQGLGEMRTIKLGRSRLREEIIERQVESTLSYKLSSGRPLRHYHVDIDLTPLPEGTEIRWYTTVRSRVPGLGWLYRREMRKMSQQFVDGLVMHSAREDGAAYE